MHAQYFSVIDCEILLSYYAQGWCGAIWARGVGGGGAGGDGGAEERREN